VQRPLAIMLALILLYTSASRTNVAAEPAIAADSLRVLLVVAHPDDEYEMAGTVYRIAKELSGTVDQLIVTDGQAGFHYTTLAERYYNRSLAEESAGRKSLPGIRRKEARQAARILGIRHQWFLNEKDEHFTLSAREVLEKEWHTDKVRQSITRRLRQVRYDYLFVLLPTKDTHGAHKAASILALEAVEQLPQDQRPIVLAAEAGATNSGSYEPVDQFPITSTVTPDPKWHFDRDAHFGYRNSLTYQIVVNWVIAEHKSQGLFQNRCGKDRFENFWSFQMGLPTSLGETNAVPARDTNTINGAHRDLTAIPEVLTN